MQGMRKWGVCRWASALLPSGAAVVGVLMEGWFVGGGGACGRTRGGGGGGGGGWGPGTAPATPCP